MPPWTPSGGWPASVSPGFHPFDEWALGFLFLGLAVVAAIVAITHQRSRAFSPSIVYLALGAVAAVGVSVLGTPWLGLVEDAEVVEHLSELAVIVALFATGMRLDRRLSLRGWLSTILLLGVVMPVTIVVVAAFGRLAMGLSLGAAIVLGAALAPTDPVLAGDVGVGPPDEEDEREPGFAIASEAGLNDGLAFPFLLLGFVIAQGADAGDLLGWVSVDVLFGIAAGVGIGAAGGWAIATVAGHLRERDMLAAELDGWAAVAAVLGVYGATQVIDGYGFLAAFVGGIAFRRRERGHEINEGVHAGAQTLERVLELAMILLLGSLLTLDGLGTPGVAGWLLAPVLLVLVRPLACLAALAPTPLDRTGRLWVGWFGVRGVGSIYYGAVALGSGILSVSEGSQVMWTIVAVVVVSIIVHGVTGAPLTARLHDRHERAVDAIRAGDSRP